MYIHNLYLDTFSIIYIYIWIHRSIPSICVHVNSFMEIIIATMLETCKSTSISFACLSTCTYIYIYLSSCNYMCNVYVSVSGSQIM